MSVVSRVILVAYFLEVGLLLILAPWSLLWDRNFFIQSWPDVASVARNPYVRGAVSGLGLINVVVGCAELIDLIRRGITPPGRVV